MKKYILLLLVIFTLKSEEQDVIDFTDQKSEKQRLFKEYKKIIRQCRLLKDPEAIKACKVRLRKEFRRQRKKLEAQENNKDCTGEVLGNFANVAANFGKMVSAPEDPQNIFESLYAMLLSMFNIISTMTKKMPLPKEEAQEITKVNEDTKKDLKENIENTQSTEAIAQPDK